MIEGYLQAAARAIRDSQPGDLAVERMRNDIYKHIYEAIEICARYAFSARTTSPPATRHPVRPPPAHSGGGAGGGAGDLADDLDLLK